MNYRKIVKEYFNIEAHKYGGRTKARFRDIPKTIREMRITGVLLDVGCGKGEFVNYIKNNFDNLFPVGIDISKEMLKSRNGTQANFVLGDALWLPFKEISVNVIYMDALLHHIISNSVSTSLELQNKFVNEILKVIKKNGLFIVQELYYELLFSALSKCLFYVLKLRKKIDIPIFFKEPLVIIDLKTKKMWLQFFNNFQNKINIFRWYIIPHIPSLNYKLAGVKEIGNIIIFMKKY